MTKRYVPPRIRAKEHEDFRLPDSGLHGDIVTADVEKAYRRGYCQGVSEGLRAVSLGITTQGIQRWLLVLRKWRAPMAGCIKGQPVICLTPPHFTVD